MSASATEVAPVTVRELLQAYNVHRTGGDAPDATESADPEDDTATSTNTYQVQPRPDWLPDRRRVPGYRPVQTSHSLSSRPGGLNEVEEVVVTVAFIGVWLVGRASKIWRSTGGKINDRYFRYEVGGDW